MCRGIYNIVSGAAANDIHYPIAKLATYSAEWTDAWYESKFPRFAFANAAEGTLLYRGDKVKFQNGFGAWQHHVYTCMYDPKAQKVLNVAARPGHLD